MQRTISKKLILNINFKVPSLPCATRTLKQILQFTVNTNGFTYVPIIKISDCNFCLTEKQQNPEDCRNQITWMDTQSVITIATPFLVFGGVFAVLLLVWDRS